MWYYASDGEQVGPVEDAKIASLIAGGTVTRETSVWQDGMEDWVPAGQTELFETSMVPPPNVPSAEDMPEPAPYAPGSTRTLWLWYVWLIAAGIPLCIIVIGFFGVIAGLVIGYVLLYRYWVSIQDPYARSTPGKAVGFCFIPFFNIYWLYVAMVGLAQDMNAYCDRYDVEGPRVSEGMALTCYILLLGSIVPYIGILIAVAAVVIQIILYKQFADVSEAIRVAAENDG